MWTRNKINFKIENVEDVAQIVLPMNLNFANKQQQTCIIMLVFNYLTGLYGLNFE